MGAFYKVLWEVVKERVDVEMKLTQLILSPNSFPQRILVAVSNLRSLPHPLHPFSSTAALLVIIFSPQIRWSYPQLMGGNISTNGVSLLCK